MAMHAQSKTPSSNGLIPTDFNTVAFKPAPIKNNVTVSPIFAKETKEGATKAVCGR